MHLKMNPPLPEREYRRFLKPSAAQDTYSPPPIPLPPVTPTNELDEVSDELRTMLTGTHDLADIMRQLEREIDADPQSHQKQDFPAKLKADNGVRNTEAVVDSMSDMDSMSDLEALSMLQLSDEFGSMFPEKYDLADIMKQLEIEMQAMEDHQHDMLYHESDDESDNGDNGITGFAMYSHSPHPRKGKLSVQMQPGFPSMGDDDSQEEAEQRMTSDNTRVKPPVLPSWSDDDNEEETRRHATYDNDDHHPDNQSREGCSWLKHDISRRHANKDRSFFPANHSNRADPPQAIAQPALKDTSIYDSREDYYKDQSSLEGSLEKLSFDESEEKKKAGIPSELSFNVDGDDEHFERKSSVVSRGTKSSKKSVSKRPSSKSKSRKKSSRRAIESDSDSSSDDSDDSTLNSEIKNADNYSDDSSVVSYDSDYSSSSDSEIEHKVSKAPTKASKKTRKSSTKKVSKSKSRRKSSRALVSDSDSSSESSESDSSYSEPRRKSKTVSNSKRVKYKPEKKSDAKTMGTKEKSRKSSVPDKKISDTKDSKRKSKEKKGATDDSNKVKSRSKKVDKQSSFEKEERKKARKLSSR
jgi:hypothetical protein